MKLPVSFVFLLVASLINKYVFIVAFVLFILVLFSSFQMTEIEIKKGTGLGSPQRTVGKIRRGRRRWKRKF